jgi:thiopurine S-methyltransferase
MIGFHEGKPNELLVRHVSAIEHPGRKLRVLVPLAGKAADLSWLAERGHEVVGVEFVLAGIEQFFRERGLDPQAHRADLGGVAAFTAGPVTMIHEDFFRLAPEAVGRFDAIYDRAAMIALDPSTRERYVATCRALSKDDARTLLVAITYDQTKTHGPPFSLDEDAVRGLFTGRTVDVLERQRVAANARMRSEGIETLEETAYLVT